MVTHWMRVGFVHGVMNTDNMSILGLTMDYGPYGWLEGYQPNWTPNTTDAGMRRYCYGNQPQVASWNLFCFANAIYPLIEEVEPIKEVLESHQEMREGLQTEMMGQKLGLSLGVEDAGLVEDLEAVLLRVETDMTLFYRGLADVPCAPEATDEALLAPVRGAAYAPDAWEKTARESTLAWLRRYTERVRQVGLEDSERRVAMNAVNPKYVLRNYLAQLAIDDAEQGDPTKLLERLDVMRRPYDEQPGREVYAERRPEWARNRPGCSTLSCSS